LRKQQLHELDKSLKEDGKIATAFPAWAIALRTQVEKKLAAIRAAVPTGADGPKDLPDATHLAWLGEDVRLRLFVSQPAANAPDKLVWNSGLMSPALSEDQQKDTDALVRSVREQTALLRGLKIELVDKADTPALTNILMPAIPATISAPGMNLNGTSITGATNDFGDFFTDPDRKHFNSWLFFYFSLLGVFGWVLGGILILAISGLTQNP
jgi:hypothetical protein